MNSGYTPCACRDCMEIAISNDIQNPDMCWECVDAQCELDTKCQCQRPSDEELEYDESRMGR